MLKIDDPELSNGNENHKIVNLMHKYIQQI